MTLAVVFRREAQLDFAEAARWYEGQSSGLGHRFAARVEDALSQVLEAPQRPASILENIRRVRTREFPYFVYYLLEESRVVVLAILHARRDPASWLTRK